MPFLICSASVGSAGLSVAFLNAASASFTFLCFSMSSCHSLTISLDSFPIQSTDACVACAAFSLNVCHPGIFSTRMPDSFSIYSHTLLVALTTALPHFFASLRSASINPISFV
jgi:hypothetical protein